MALHPHGGLIRPPGKTPVWFATCIRIMPLGVLMQFLLAGFGLFEDAGFEMHVVVGAALGVPAFAIFAGAVLVARLRPLAWWAGSLVASYLVQVALAAGGDPSLLAYHPFNGALVLVASVVLFAEVEHGKASLD
ncbi:DUF6220 domain-containing protein [Caenispirillum bisanense]|uniref:Uncharacterized protein n=1 Tax=Caenispirillum bisanense TaxID=414052 RepID=A0A286GTB0_9PROT|nr:DUF6220 domain-containing protein [Caenispirillum bisanense]SOD98309.1 hypothetical protein SAMN05421508_107295 [Caenispirillum bisanense]